MLVKQDEVMRNRTTAKGTWDKLYLEDVTCGLQLGFLLLLLRGHGDGVLHAHLGSRLGKVLVQLNLQAESANSVKHTQHLPGIRAM